MFTLRNFAIRNLLPPANKVCEGYVFTRVCLSTGGGVPGQVRHPGQVLPPWAGTPPRQVQPPGQASPLEEAPPPRAVHAGRYGQQAGGMHPTGMHSCAICYLFYFSHLLLFLFWVFKSRNQLKISLLSMKLSSHTW